MQVLVVDDDPLYRKMLAKTLRGWDYEVLTAENGEEALEILEETDVRIVISDWVMPGIDGPELCKRIREKLEQSSEAIKEIGYHYVILLSARTDDESMVQGLSVGADDFIVKPFKPNELAARLYVGERILSLETTLKNQIGEIQIAQQEAAEAHEQLKLDLQSAATFQQSFLPHELPFSDTFHYAWSYQPCNTIGGDYLSIFTINNQFVGLVVVDVSGHGVQSALASVAISQEFQWLTSGANKEVDPTSPEEVALYLNEKHQLNMETEIYFTMFYGVLDLHEQSVKYVSAGTPNPIFTKPNGKTIALEGYGMPVGLVSEPSFVYEQIDFQPDDRLFVFSDGVIEAFSPSRNQWGQERCRKRLTELNDASLDETILKLADSVSQWTGDRELNDDLSIVAVECFANGAMNYTI